MTRTVVVGYDGSQTSREALSWALHSAELRNVGVTVVHVLTMPTTFMPGYGAVSEPSPDMYNLYAEELLTEAKDLASHEKPAVEVSTQLITGYPASGLLSTLDQAELVALGSRGLGSFSELLLGSVSLELASRAPCPVVVFRPRTAATPGSEAGRVVVGVDGSPSSERALGSAFEEASMRRVGLTAIQAWTEPYFELPGKGGGALPEPLVVDVFKGEEMRWLSEQLAGWREKYPDVELRQIVQHGSPGGVISEASAGAELVVVGSRGRGGFKTLLLGSVSHAVLHHAHCPVMIVRPVVGHTT
jgi:nucleotide-binding universal stress UspA family protein